MTKAKSTKERVENVKSFIATGQDAATILKKTGELHMLGDDQRRSSNRYSNIKRWGDFILAQHDGQTMDVYNLNLEKFKEFAGNFFFTKFFTNHSYAFVLTREKDEYYYSAISRSLDISSTNFYSNFIKCIHDEYFIIILKDKIVCHNLRTGTENWVVDLTELISTGVANGGLWCTGSSIVLRTEPEGESINGKLFWLDPKSGKVLHKRHDGMHLMQRLDERLFHMYTPFDPDGYLKIISLKDGTTELDLPVYSFFEQYRQLHETYLDNYQYVLDGTLLYAMHFEQKAISIFNLDQKLLLNHFLIETTALYLRELQVKGGTMFILDSNDTLHHLSWRESSHLGCA